VAIRAWYRATVATVECVYTVVIMASFPLIDEDPRSQDFIYFQRSPAIVNVHNFIVPGSIMRDNLRQVKKSQ
jgi:hypothetical protein